MTVLIVEDNAGVRRMLRRALEEFAHELWECNDGVYALTLYKQHHPDLVLMDIKMPITDGLAATKQIRIFDPLARIVIVTDYDDEELRSAAMAAGASGYALKQDLTSLGALLRQGQDRAET